MPSKLILPLIAVVGLAFAIYMITQNSAPKLTAAPVSPPPEKVFTRSVSGAGLIEPSSENIHIGAPVSALIVAVPVKVGDRVKKGDVLFQLDGRLLQSQLASQQAALKVAQANLAKLESMPRSEDVPPVEARVAQQRANLEDWQAQLARVESVVNPGAVSQDDLTRRRFGVKQAQAQLKQAEAELALLQAGAWKPDLEVARSQIDSAQAQIDATKVELDRLVVRAPIDAQVLQVNIRVGEFAQAGQNGQALMTIGDTSKLHVRVDIDENDAWRVSPKASAVAYARGNKDLYTALTFVRFEPMVVPKKSLTGDSTERVDTRVLQVIYAFAAPEGKPGPKIYVGQQMDVYIDTDTEAGGLGVGPTP